HSVEDLAADLGVSSRHLRRAIEDQIGVTPTETFGRPPSEVRREHGNDHDERRLSLLEPLLRRRPGLRLPGSVDLFEMATRGVIGQQISVKGAVTLMGRLVRRFGTPLGEQGVGLLTHTFPTADTIATTPIEDLAAIGLPRKRAETLAHLACAFASGRFNRPARDGASVVEELTELPGIGDWTAQYLAMRAFHLPDAFPAGDLGVRKALGELAPAAARRRAEAWRPWRSYAVIHLWAALSQGELP
ncbi:MAG: DNA-3-methyladenine glycosylase 2 family protein, partial [Cyanobacteria bacterium NC_groundwater_1444_Ag_S-0.65um_54_12]|nr:DNA-3-methyladenine glycosylase 2 family protein [Cyanobacteria bacterium NC_groundwater_1444_Ag_S-0.65um_54_12]